MKKTRTARVAFALLFSAIFALSGCAKKGEELSTYQGETKDSLTGKSVYNKELFYRNDYFASSADPFVLDDTARSGYYYLYRTQDRLYTLRSKDLVNWSNVGNTLSTKNGVLSDLAETVSKNIAYQNIWAAEVIYDEIEEQYYAFFSATPKSANDTTGGEGVQEETGEMYNLYVAAADSPEGPFELVNFRDDAAVSGGYYHDYNVTAGRTEIAENSLELLDSEGYVFAYPQDYAEYCYIDPQAGRYYYEQNEGIGVGGNRLSDSLRGHGFAQGIDPHPYVADNGDKYLYWVVDYADGYANRVYGVKMKTDENGKSSWLAPDFSTMKLLTMHGYYTVEDFLKEKHPKDGEEAVSAPSVTYEYPSTRCNEGPFVISHGGKYYLTYSANGYAQATYCVVQAVSDSPLGPFRKLTEAENGVLISSDGGASPRTSGPGHHSFVTVGEQLYICYHKHRDYTVGGGIRGYSIDEVKWLSITDKDGNPLDVMYVNGATISEQPTIFGEYKNVVEGKEASVKKGSLAANSSVKYLTDGLLSMNTIVNAAFVSEYVKETEISETTTFEFSFDRPQAIRALMIYNSKDPNKVFLDASAEFVCEVDGKEKTYKISKIAFDLEQYAETADVDGQIMVLSVVHGASAYAEFSEIKVKTARITVNVPAGKTVGISEIRMLGK